MSDTWLQSFSPNPQASVRLFCFAHAGGGALDALHGVFEVLVAATGQPDDQPVAGELVRARPGIARDVLDAVGLHGGGQQQREEQQRLHSGDTAAKKRCSQPMRLCSAISPVPP